MDPVEIRFHGAAGTVTGSCFELRTKGTRTLEALNHEPLPFETSGIDAVILSHAHLDHSGRLPYLVASGCTAPIWTTEPTADIIEPLLLDAAKLQAADAERRNRRPDRAGLKAFEPLYSAEDVAACPASCARRAIATGTIWEAATASGSRMRTISWARPRSS